MCGIEPSRAIVSTRLLFPVFGLSMSWRQLRRAAIRVPLSRSRRRTCKPSASAMRAPAGGSGLRSAQVIRFYSALDVRKRRRLQLLPMSAAGTC